MPFTYCRAIFSTPVLYPAYDTLLCCIHCIILLHAQSLVPLSIFCSLSPVVNDTRPAPCGKRGIRQSYKSKWVNRLACHFRRHLSLHWPHCSICLCAAAQHSAAQSLGLVVMPVTLAELHLNSYVMKIRVNQLTAWRCLTMRSKKNGC